MSEAFIEHEKSSHSVISLDSSKDILEESDIPDLEPISSSEDNISKNDEIENIPEEEKEKSKEPEEPKPEWVDLLGSGAIMKKIIAEGKPDTRPQRSEKCIINYSCYLEDETLVDSADNFELNLGESDVIQGLDVSLGLMNIGEKCRLKIEPRLAFGKKGLPSKIPGDSLVIYDVELVNVEPDDDVDMMPITLRRVKGNKKRERGNWWYTRGENNIAIQCYRRALDYLDEVEGGDQSKGEISDSDLQSILEDRVSVCNNMAAAQIKMEMYSAALNSLQVVLRCQPNNVKAHYRKAMAYKGQNDLTTAMKCLQKAKEYAPNDPDIQKEINAMTKLIQKQKNSEKELAKRMFNGTAKPESNNKSSKKSSGGKFIVWATLGAALAVGAAGVFAYRLKI
ncbi:peptidyl-prolyl cis-trans isomerase FKBP8 [Diabrotica undecimpunctata]|uniref:peptidyl-prolyl cis-trans isomerase FKBP8 n=1 Tax=Diabrotica undecimpunctata TaxID=50387 RepID=UPI003B63CDF3